MMKGQNVKIKANARTASNKYAGRVKKGPKKDAARLERHRRNRGTYD